MEADTVAHGGSSMSGDFIWSITMTDNDSGWTENRAIWNKGSAGVIRQVTDIEQCFPFTLKGFNCDNGSEFLNHHLEYYFGEGRSQRVPFFRSRPYRKNDLAKVEQKNWTHVRQLFGYDRLDNKLLVELMNDLYRHEASQLRNFFFPQIKLLRKTRIGGRIKREYDAPQTPYQRLLNSSALTDEQKNSLRQTYVTLDPFKLTQSLETKLKQIFALHRKSNLNHVA